MRPPFLDEPPAGVLFFGGKGGVGKTTCAAAAALELARDRVDGRFLLVSTDPAHSLDDCLAGLQPPVNLTVLELDAGARLAAFEKENRPQLQEIAERGTFLDGEDVSALLDLSLPGIDELMAFLELSRWVQEHSYDTVVVDTAPTGHTLRLLSMPQVVRGWLEALDALLAKHRYMLEVFRGGYEPDAADALLLDLDAAVTTLTELLGDADRCRFVPVMLAEDLSLHETALLLAELERLRVTARDLVVNRLRPAGDCATCTALRASQRARLRAPPWGVGRDRDDPVGGYRYWGVPLYPGEVRGEAALSGFWEGVARIAVGEADVESRAPIPPPPPRVESPADPPGPEAGLLLFAGKGGVGKTTLACATALALAKRRPETRILLVSVDPAHSLSACLRRDVGREPTPVAPGLAAMELEAPAELDALRSAYGRDLETLFERVSPNVDLTFDRRVMERMLELAPPGLDEVMALTGAGRLLAGQEHDVLVMDTAPTGHFVRVLEMPELIDRWLKVFFALLLKYRSVWRVPRISEKLVQLSKDLKQLRALLGDSVRAAVYAVATPTRMALAETLDLVAACGRHRVHVSALLANQVEESGGCALCSTSVRCQEEVLAELRKATPRRQLTRVYRRGEPRGLAALTVLGETLFRWPAPPATKGAIGV